MNYKVFLIFLTFACNLALQQANNQMPDNDHAFYDFTVLFNRNNELLTSDIDTIIKNLLNKFNCSSYYQSLDCYQVNTNKFKLFRLFFSFIYSFLVSYKC